MKCILLETNKFKLRKMCCCILFYYYQLNFKLRIDYLITGFSDDCLCFENFYSSNFDLVSSDIPVTDTSNK